MIIHRIIAFLIGYAAGNISPGLIFAKLNNVNLRESGSGNVGSTNVARTVGIKIGLLTLLCDCMKAILPAIITYFLFKNFYIGSVRFLMVYSAFGAVVGHLFPVALKFKGGKGIATSAGLILIAAPIAIIACLIVFFISVITTRYVSLGSILCAIVLPIEMFIFLFVGMLDYPFFVGLEICIIFFVDAAICALKHKDNVKRLIAGNENKFSLKKKEKQ